MGGHWNSTAEMGAGTLIMFIAFLLVAAVAAGVLLSTSMTLQEKSLQTGDDSERKISTNINVISISATDGQSDLTDFEQIFKLSPGSYPIKLEDMTLTFNTIDLTSTMVYRGENSICEKNNQDGYNTFTSQEIGELNISEYLILNEDLDYDGLDDAIFINVTHVFVNLSGSGLKNISLGIDLSDASENPKTIDIYNYQLLNGSTVVAYITIQGTTDLNNTIINNVTFQIAPQLLYRGYFSAVYENEGTNYLEGKIQQGDVLRLCYEAPRSIGEDEFVRINIIPKIGSTTMSSFYTSQAISNNRVFLYP